MRIKLFSILFLMTGIILTSNNPANSQVLQVSSDITPEEMVEILIGNGLSYDNVVFTRADISRGNFWGGPGNIGIINGIILTSGSVNVAPGPNNSNGAGFNADQSGDPDLNAIAGGISTFDAFTTVLTAWAEVEPMQTYHIKLAVGDGLDHVFDSGVLLQASSFCSGPQTGTGNEQTASDNFRIFPVPAADIINITFDDGQDFSVVLIGQDGRKYTEISGKSQVTIDLSELPAGIYFLRITDDNGVATRKIYKK